MTKLGLFAVMILGAAAFAAAQHSHMMDMPMMQDCPMSVEGTTLNVTDTRDGVALTFTTKSGDVGELRRKVEKMAKMHDAKSSSMPMMSGMISASAKYEEVPDGARLTLIPKKAAELQQLRAQVRDHAEQMNKGGCRMMHDMNPGMSANDIPKSLKNEHAELHLALEQLTHAGGRTGEATKAVAAALENHFAKETEYALPPLSLLGPLSEGKFECSMTSIVEKTDKLQAELPNLLSEHKVIAAALSKLKEAAEAERKPAGVQFVEKLTAHALSEEEIMYPAAALVGQYVKSNAARCR